MICKFLDRGNCETGGRSEAFTSSPQDPLIFQRTWRVDGYGDNPLPYTVRRTWLIIELYVNRVSMIASHYEESILFCQNCA